MPSWFCKDELSDSSFVRVLGDYQLPTQTIYAVTLGKPPTGSKVSAFIQFTERLLKDS